VLVLLHTANDSRNGSDMDDSVTLDGIVTQLRALLQREYQRGVDDAMRRVMEAAQSTFSASAQPAPPPPRPAEQHVSAEKTPFTRASRGAPDALIRRVLALRHPKGANSVEIQGMAHSDAERKVSLSGIRFALDRGRESGRYRQQNGDWFLTEAPSAEAEEAS
jgi:hypothetical protein